MEGVPALGRLAPDSVLPSHLGGEVGLGGFRGKKHVLLLFYVLDWTGT